MQKIIFYKTKLFRYSPPQPVSNNYTIFKRIHEKMRLTVLTIYTREMVFCMSNDIKYEFFEEINDRNADI